MLDQKQKDAIANAVADLLGKIKAEMRTTKDPQRKAELDRLDTQLYAGLYLMGRNELEIGRAHV
jgi:hypothetical protein